MKKVYVFLAEGFEEVEAITPIDVLRRAGVEVATVGIGGQTITGSHGIPVVADIAGEGFRLPEDAAMVFLPGGGPGTQNLLDSPVVRAAVDEAAARGLWLAAICAAPKVLSAAGQLRGKRVTAFPDVRAGLEAGEVTDGPVEVDGRVITGRGAGVALQFGHALAGALAGKAEADAVLAKMQAVI